MAHPDGRPLQIRVRVSRAERALVEKAAEVTDLGLSEWVRQSIIDCANQDIEDYGPKGKGK